MLTLMNYNIRKPKEKAALVDIYVGDQQIVVNVPIQELNIKLVAKTNIGEVICESLIYKEFEHLKEEEEELLLDERNNDPGC